jgi:hypothetical protein
VELASATTNLFVKLVCRGRLSGRLCIFSGVRLVDTDRLTELAIREGLCRFGKRIISRLLKFPSGTLNDSKT